MITDLLSRAKNYPYPIPNSSYIFQDGRVSEITTRRRVIDLNKRTPVLAVGSNQSPIQLGRKFQGRNWGPIPVLRIRLHGFDVAYSAHIASYGAIPATLQESQNVQATLFVNWLDEAQLTRMHHTEITDGNYGFGLLVNLNIDVETGPSLNKVFTYVSKHGTLCDMIGPILVSKVSSRKRRRPGFSQLEVQKFARDKIAPDFGINQFIQTSIDYPEIRLQRSERLKVMAQHFIPKWFEEIRI